MAVRVDWSAAPRCPPQEAAVVVVDFSRKHHQIGLSAAPKTVAQHAVVPFLISPGTRQDVTNTT